MARTLLVILGLVFFNAIDLYSQVDIKSDAKHVRIKTDNGSVFKGEIIERSTDRIKIKTEYGEAEVKMSEVTAVTYLNVTTENNTDIVTIVEDTEGLKNNYSGSHYLLSQSGYGLQKGERYYENIYVFWNSYTVGLSDNFSISMGGEIASLLFGGRLPIIFVTPKYSKPFEGGAFSFSSSVFTSPEDNFSAFIFFQGAVTLGNRRDNITLGVSTGLNTEDGFLEETYPITLSGQYGLNDRLSFISENWFFDTGRELEVVFSLGLRIFGKNNKNSFLTLSLVRPTEDLGSLIGIPFFSGTVAIK